MQTEVRVHVERKNDAELSIMRGHLLGWWRGRRLSAGQRRPGRTLSADMRLLKGDPPSPRRPRPKEINSVRRTSVWNTAVRRGRNHYQLGHAKFKQIGD